MLSPRSVRLFLDQTSNRFRYSTEEAAQIDAYVAAMRVVERRVGRAPRTALTNCTPVHVESLVAELQAVRVSGTPHRLDPAHEPVQLNEGEVALFMKRGDHYRLSTGEHTVYVALNYAISPHLVIEPSPIVQANPLDAAVIDADAITLLRIVQDRELTLAEQLLAAKTMPLIWRRLGGEPVCGLPTPTPADAHQLREFASNFSNAEARLLSLIEVSSEWRATILGDNAGNEQQPSAPSTTTAPVRAPRWA